MTDSYTEIYLHLVWRTKHNRRLLSGELETYVHEKCAEFADDLGLGPIAINSAWDHVHGLYRWRSSVTVADAVRVLKSKTAVEWNRSIRNGERTGDLLEWQTGFGAVSVRRSDVRTVCRYIDDQKERHRRDRIWTPFEAVVPPEQSAA